MDIDFTASVNRPMQY